MKIFVAGSGKGKGVAVDNKTKKEVFMDMLELQAGLGIGVKKFSLVWVFETPQALATFMNSGWELGGQTSAAAKTGDKGGSFQGAIAVGPASGSISSRRPAWRWSSRRRARNTTRTSDLN